MKSFFKFSLIPLLLHALAGQAALTVTNIALGAGYHSLFLKSDGSLWGMGNNGQGELGDGTYSSTNRPKQIMASAVLAVAAGNRHSLFVKSDGSLWAMGYNIYGQLGDGTFSTNAPYGTNRPKQIMASAVSAVAAGIGHSLFLKSDGSLWGMGENNYGELGDGTYSSTNRPKQIVASGVTAIAGGGYHTVFLKSDGSLWTMGDNEYGQLGDGTLPLTRTNQPEQIVTSGVTAIAAGVYHSMFLKSDGSLWAMGYNIYGQLGDGTFSTNAPFGTNRPKQIVASGVTAIAGGGYHSLFLRSDGSLWAMGRNDYGQLGDGTLTNASWPEQIIASGVTAIAAGVYHSMFLKSDGSLWAMGLDDSGQLGDGFSSTTALPEQIFPVPQPVLAQALLFKTNLQFTATCGFGGNFSLLAGTNIDQPLSHWTPIQTNVITSRGTNNFSATLTNPITGGQRFFRLISN